MGDRTQVTLTVLRQHLQEAIDLIDPEQGQPSEIDPQDNDTVSLIYEEVNYGTIEHLGLLRSAGIPYSFEWGSGGSYSEGEEHLRYLIDGTPEQVTFEKDWPENTILECLEVIKDRADPAAALQAFLANHQEPSWDNQLDYSNVARAIKLIVQ